MSNARRTRAWVEIDPGALCENFQTIRRAIGPGSEILPMVKADGYGVGAERVVRALEPLLPWGYGVATAEEGAAVRGYLRALLGEAGEERPVFVAGPLPPDSVATAAEAGLIPSISDVDGLARWAEAAAAAPRPLSFHVEIDTGMGRAGFDWRETARWAEAVRAMIGPKLRWTGVFTHFQGADATERLPTETQWERFRDALAQLPGPREDLFVHAANSAAALRWREFALDAVRPGIFLYGGHPAPGIETLASPRPVVRVRARVLLVRDVPPGSTTGYGATYVARRWERWATLGIGYGDGLPRALGNEGAALVRGRRAPIVGRVSMDLTVVDVTEVAEVVAGDVATLIGRDEDGHEITLEEVAAHAGTISYEILTGLTPRLPRVERTGG